MLQLFIILISLTTTCLGIVCYDCYGTGPDHKDCTKDRVCKGIACMLFDAGDNQTATAFCLLAMKGDKMDQAKDGCWLEPDGKGKHCMCFSDYCNRLVDRRFTAQVDSMTPLLPNAEFLKQNPLVDYETPKLTGDDSNEDGAAPVPDSVLFPGAAKADPKTLGAGSDDEDLVPVDFSDYMNTPDEKEKVGGDIDTNQITSDNLQSTTPKYSSLILLLFPVAVPWARFFAIF
ncbi:hypothetical protein WR25_06985 [Diploscapter pachys]|uniref:Uncharacterized protein n=1 Tax=Diploscapter pachys TaxID=2018661 RepID=A0A2A2KP75_9BILA|nr:hypothetical protein WR25_06985 [Diploscapter pachys]